MEAVLSTLGREMYCDGRHRGFMVPWSLLSPLCRRWSRNRPPDSGRVDALVQHRLHGGYVPLLLHVAIVKEATGLACYDGNHRREMLDRLMAEHGRDEHVIVDVLTAATEEEVFAAFSAVNQAVSVPASYVECVEDNADKALIREQILELVKRYEKSYPSHVSSSPRFHAPHFNRDAFIDNVYDLYRAFERRITVPEIGGLLNVLNEWYSKERLCQAHAMYKSHVIDKCRKTGLYLFLDRAVPIAHVREVFLHLG